MDRRRFRPFAFSRVDVTLTRMSRKPEPEKQYVRLGVLAAATADKTLMPGGDPICDPEIVVNDATRMAAAYVGATTSQQVAKVHGIIASTQGAPASHPRGSAPRHGDPGYRANPTQCAVGEALDKLDKHDLGIGTYRGIETLVKRVEIADDPVEAYLTVLSVMET